MIDIDAQEATVSPQTLITPQRIIGIASRATQLFSNADVENALKVMATNIHQDLSEEDPIVLCVMIGGIILTGKLLTLLDFPLQVDYLHATRYGNNLTGGGLSWLVEPRVSLKGRTVLVVDDILDRGHTLASILKYCKAQGAKNVKTAVLVEKQVSRAQEVVQKADYTGVIVEDRYVYGYGMDYKGYLRNAPGVFAVAKEDR